jgi:hypothetical protein
MLYHLSHGSILGHGLTGLAGQLVPQSSTIRSDLLAHLRLSGADATQLGIQEITEFLSRFEMLPPGFFEPGLEPEHLGQHLDLFKGLIIDFHVRHFVSS